MKNENLHGEGWKYGEKSEIGYEKRKICTYKEVRKQGKRKRKKKGKPAPRGREIQGKRERNLKTRLTK